MKGQLSLEALLLTLFQIGSVLLLLGASFLLLKATDKALERYNFLKEEHWVREVANEVCVLGNGQRRPVRLMFSHNISTECGDVKLSAGAHVLENVQGKLKVSG